MQGWVVAIAWVVAVLFAFIALGFLGYELSWKLDRLTKDRQRLRVLIGELNNLVQRPRGEG